MIHTQQRTWTEEGGWSEPVGDLPKKPQLVFVFGDEELVSRPELFQQVRQFYPDAYILTSSTAGNILDTVVNEKAVTVSALYFEKTRIWFSETTVENIFDSKNVGKKLADFLPTDDLVHSFVLSDGLAVNGSDLVRSINEHLPASVTVTGGLAGDGDRFKKTVVSCNSIPKSNRVVLIGFYGEALRVGFASRGGWIPYEDTYTITKAKGNVLYELDGKPALDVYKELLGPESAKLPSSALLFPLQLILPEEGTVVRTILSVDEAEKSMTFAGDMPQGSVGHFMHATKENLIESAGQAASESTKSLAGTPAQFALLVSCVGRRLVLKDRTHEEIEAVRAVLGPKAKLHGFYSYGELCPATGSKNCLLHNQTMTITTFSEV